jgi:tetratricopeptide (TPR) repeat protein
MTTCFKCNSNSSEDARFCPQCGTNLKNLSAITPKRIFVTLMLGVALFTAAWYSKDSITGKRPTKSMSEIIAAENEIEDTEIKQLKSEVEQSPQDIDKLRKLASLLIDKLKSSPAPSMPLIHSAIETFGKILAIDPKDANALIAMADISFDGQAFDKAESFYQRYLEIQPDDINARARYGSTLTFIGKFDLSLKELEQILKKDPKHFQAAAYIAITYAQMGKIDIAKEKAKAALLLAPSEEAKNRFTQFIEALDKDTSSSLNDYIKNHQIAGPKFAGHELESGTVLVWKFKNFPMSEMPPFAKEKFFNGIKTEASKISGLKIEKIRFVDVTTNKELDSLSLK